MCRAPASATRVAAFLPKATFVLRLVPVFIPRETIHSAAHAQINHGHLTSALNSVSQVRVAIDLSLIHGEPNHDFTVRTKRGLAGNDKMRGHPKQQLLLQSEFLKCYLLQHTVPHLHPRH